MARRITNNQYDILKCCNCGWQYPAPVVEKLCVSCGGVMRRQTVTVVNGVQHLVSDYGPVIEGEKVNVTQKAIETANNLNWLYRCTFSGTETEATYQGIRYAGSSSNINLISELDVMAFVVLVADEDIITPWLIHDVAALQELKRYYREQQQIEDLKYVVLRKYIGREEEVKA